MKNDLSSGTIWNKAAVSGFLLAVVTIAFTMLSSLASHVEGFGGKALGFVVWAAKLCSCVVLFAFFLSKLKKDSPEADYKAVHGYGIKIAALSSILVAAYSLIGFMNMDQGSYNEILNSVLERYENSGMALDSNSISAMEKMGNKLPSIGFVMTFLYCFVWGWVLTAIYSKKIAPNDPFADLESK